jgi:hypothetical protein
VRRIVATSGTRLDVASAWAVIQVELATRMTGRADLNAIAARRRLPAEVLAPVFDRATEAGYLNRDGWGYAHTAAGSAEAELIGRAWTEWLEERVEQDIGRPPGTDLRAAVKTVARRLLTEDETDGPRVAVGAGTGTR